MPHFQVIRRHFPIGMLLMLLCIAPLVGCGGGGGGGGTPTIGANGGTVTSSDGRATVIFPPGVLTSDNAATLAPVPSPAGVSGLDTTGMPAYSLELANPTNRTLRHGRAVEGDYLVLKIKVDAFDQQNDTLYASRPDINYPIILPPQYEPSTGVLTVSVPYGLLEADTTKATARGISLAIPKITFGEGHKQRSAVDYTAQIKALRTFDPSMGALGNWVDKWPAAAATNGKRIAIVVPGTFATIDDPKDSSFVSLASFLAQLGRVTDGDSAKFFDMVIGLNYNTLAEPDQSGSLLAEKIKPYLTAGARLYLFAHSQGGLVSRWALERGGAQNAKMLVMFDTPNEGIPATEIGTHYNFPKSLLGDHYWDAPSGNAMAFKEPFHYPSSESPFLMSLNSPHQSNAAYFMVYGDASDSNPANNDGGINSNELWTEDHVFVSGDSDGVVYAFSATGQDLDWNQYSVGFDAKSHTLKTDLTHNNLPNILLDSNGEKSWLADRIRLQDTGFANLNIH